MASRLKSNKHNANIYKLAFSILGMARLREVKKWGNSMVVVLSSVDVEDLKISEGDMMDIEDALIKSKRGNKK